LLIASTLFTCSEIQLNFVLASLIGFKGQLFTSLTNSNGMSTACLQFISHISLAFLSIVSSTVCSNRLFQPICSIVEVPFLKIQPETFVLSKLHKNS
jgi:hypothetical protein